MASCATTGGLVYLFAGANTSQASSPIPGLTEPIAVNTTGPMTTSSTVAAANPSIPATTAANTVAAFNGDTVQTKYGPVQVQIQVTNGKVVAIAVVQYPDGDGKSARINERALPTLQTEVLTAQSARIDTVSGATYTSNAYVKSLQSAIDDARAAGAVTA
jgi:uncharacterized protein with FMN-binding domain